MFTIILSGVFGVLVTKLLEGSRLKKSHSILVITISTILLAMLKALYHFMGESANQSAVYTSLSKIFTNFERLDWLQCILIVCALLIIAYMDWSEDRALPFKKYSEKIRGFTKGAGQNSVITIAAGDMDFFGGVKLDDVSVSKLMDNSLEYQQLVTLGKSPNLRLRILCSHGLEGDPELLNAIINGTTNPEILYNKYRSMKKLDGSTFQQLLRIGRIKTDFGSSVDIRFYDDSNRDRDFRARFIDKKGIVYRKEKGDDTKKRLKGILLRPFVEWVSVSEDRYSVNKLTEQEYAYYADMLRLKWAACDADKCKKIISFCESLYRYINKGEPRFHMALVYVNSYEIARKQEKRKEFPPFGVMYLAASVRKNPDWDVKLIAVDENTSNEALQSWVDYDVIGFSIISSYSYNILKRCHDASWKKLGAVIIAGGYQAAKFSNDVFRDFDADVVFRGEGEDSIRSFCEHYEDRNYAAIEGIIYRDANKNPKTTPGSLFVDIDKIPFPARDLIPTEDIVMTDRLAGTELKMVHMLFSRGCIYDCAYCAANQDQRIKEIRYRDKHQIVEELRFLKEAYAIDGFSIIDDCFLTDQEKAIEICDYIASQDKKLGLGLKWSLAARVDSINEKILDALSRAGCIEIKFGVETGSDELLKHMRKGATVSCAENAIRQTKAYGMNVKLFIITGLPFETDATHEETKRFLQKMRDENLVDRISLLRYTPLAGSYIYSQPSKFGVKKSVLGTENFDKVNLYRKSYNWWTEKSRYEDCERWYNDMRRFIDDRWTDE